MDHVDAGEGGVAGEGSVALRIMESQTVQTVSLFFPFLVSNFLLIVVEKGCLDLLLPGLFPT